MSDRRARLIILIIFLFGLSFVLRFDLKQVQNHGFFDDEAIYYMMAYSIAYDFDIKYEKKDLERIIARYNGLPQGIFLKKTEKGIFYAKSYAYPLAVAPFVRLFGDRGFFIFALLLLFMDLNLLYRLFRTKMAEVKALALTLAFTFCSLIWVYFFWISTELMNFSLALAGLYLALYKHLNPEAKGFIASPGSDFAAAALLGFLTFSRLTNGIYMLPAAGVYFFRFRLKDMAKAVLLGLVFLLTVAAFFGANWAATGEWNYMGGERRSFYYRFPFESRQVSFKQGHLMSTQDYWERFYLTEEIFLRNLYYYFTGRFSGMIIYYFPAFLFLLFYILQRGKKLIPTLAFLSILISIAALIALMPDNYLGGGGCLGNRYFPNIYPLFAFLLPYFSLRSLSLTFLGLPLIGVVYLVPIFASSYPYTVGKMLYMRAFPVELTQIDSLPTNINPHAFRVPYKGFLLYHLDDYFCPRQGNWIVLAGEKEAQMVLRVPRGARGFKIRVESRGRMRIELSGQSRTVWGKRIVYFPAKPSLKLRRDDLYLLKVRSYYGKLLRLKNSYFYCGGRIKIEVVR